MSTSISSFFLSPSSGEGSAHADRLHLSAWLCNRGLSWHAHGVERAPSASILLAHLHAAIPAHSLAVSSLGGDSIIGERFAHPCGPDAGQIVSKTDTM